MFNFSGIHKLFHCAPNVPHYAKNKAVGVMKTGHAFTIEPMISEGGLSHAFIGLLFPDTSLDSVPLEKTSKKSVFLVLYIIRLPPF